MKTDPKKNLSPLKDLGEEKPSKLIELVRFAWPQIEAALERGHRLKRIHEGLLACGIQISYSLFTVYIKLVRLENGAALYKSQKLPPTPVRNALPVALPDQAQPRHRALGLETVERDDLVKDSSHSGFLKEGVPNFPKLIERFGLNKS